MVIRVLCGHGGGRRCTSSAGGCVWRGFARDWRIAARGERRRRSLRRACSQHSQVLPTISAEPPAFQVYHARHQSRRCACSCQRGLQLPRLDELLHVLPRPLVVVHDVLQGRRRHEVLHAQKGDTNNDRLLVTTQAAVTSNDSDSACGEMRQAFSPCGGPRRPSRRPA